MRTDAGALWTAGIASPKRTAKLAAALAAALAALALIGSPAEAEQTHIFDETLSLTGDCSTSKADAVEDPGCPGGEHPPLGAFAPSGATAVDLHGDRYVASTASGEFEGRVDVFDAEGKFLTELPTHHRVWSMAVDSEGNLYTVGGGALRRYAPSAYEWQTGEIEYEATPTQVAPYFGELAIALDPTDDHVFVDASSLSGGTVDEYGSAAEGNPLVGSMLANAIYDSTGIAIDAARKRIYLSGFAEQVSPPHPNNKIVVRDFELEAPHQQVAEFDGSTTPGEAFYKEAFGVALAVDEASGDVFVGQLAAPKKKVYELSEDGAYVSTIEHSFVQAGYAQIAFDNGATSPTEGYLFVPSGEVPPAHSYAFERRRPPKPPEVSSPSVSGVTETEVILHAQVNPQAEGASWRIEYTTLQSFEAEGFAGATLAAQGTLAPNNAAVPISAPVSGLSPATSYRLRAVAENEAGEDAAEAGLATYGPTETFSGCENEALRLGLSAALPDCRAYELVTPSNTNGHAPYANSLIGIWFQTREASLDGSKVSFKANGGALPGLQAPGGLFGDSYLAKRGAEGWQTESRSPSGAETVAMVNGSASPDQGFSFWAAQAEGSAVLTPGSQTNYLRYPDGHSEPLGRGSIAFDELAAGKLIAEGGTHVIFSSGEFSGSDPAIQLEPNAPPDGTAAVYDRTPDEVTHVISLLPGDVTPAAGENANFVGASLDGRGVAFTFTQGPHAGTLYLRRDDATTYEVEAGATFAGVAEGGGRVFYLKGGNLFAFDAVSEAKIPFSTSGDVTPVNVAAGGTVAYFLSPGALTATPNPHGDLPLPGGENLYRSEEGQLSFIGTVSKEDAEGEAEPEQAFTQRTGLGLLTKDIYKNGTPPVQGGQLAMDSSRATADGGVLVFEASTPLDGYDPQGHRQVYRYDSRGQTLRCLSCNPTEAAAGGQGVLQTVLHEPSPGSEAPLGEWDPVENVLADGGRVFFESTEALVLRDTDGVRDVYEWEEEGLGSCAKPGGCLYLISSGTSARPNFLYATSASGEDVFFRTADLLLAGRDPDETPSIYDARVRGGFPEPAAAAGECLGEACQPQATPPAAGGAASAAYAGAGNVRSTERSCRGSSQGCANRHKRRHRHHRQKHAHRNGRKHR